MINCFIYEVQLRLIKWLTRHYLRPSDTEGFFRWYPRTRREYTQIQGLIQECFPGATTSEAIGCMYDDEPWRIMLIIRIKLASNSALIPYAVDQAFQDAWIDSKAFTGKILVYGDWSKIAWE